MDLQVPRFQPNTGAKARFARMLGEYSTEIALEVRVDTVELHAVGHKWEYDSETEFDEAKALPETIDRIHMTFSDSARRLTGQVSLGDPIAYVIWEGTEHLAVPLKRHVEHFVKEEYRVSLSSTPEKSKQRSTGLAAEILKIRQCELAANDIRGLAACIIADEDGGGLPAPGIRFSVSSGSLTLYEEDLARLLENPSLPQVFEEMNAQTRGGPPRVSVRLSKYGQSRAQIEGPIVWVRAKKQRLRNFFDQHQNTDPLGRSRVLLATLSILLLWGGSILVLSAINKVYWNVEWNRILVGSVLAGILGGSAAYQYLSEKVVATCWVAIAARRPSTVRSFGGFLLVVVVTELVSLLVALLAGWFKVQ